MMNSSTDPYDGENVTVCKISINGSILRCGWPNEPGDPTNLRYLDLATYPVLLFISTVGNCLNVFVMRRERPLSAKNVYLMTMSWLDMTYMWAASIFYVAQLTNTRSSFVKDMTGLTTSLQEFSAVASDWTLAAFSVDRFMAISSPLRHMKNRSAKGSLLVILVILLASCSLASLRLIDYYWFLANDPGPPCDLPVRPVIMAQLRLFYTWTLPLIPIFTFLTILILNGLLMRVLVKNRRERRDRLELRVSFSANPPRSHPPANLERNAFLMLAACVLLYLITQAPATVLNVIETFDVACIRRYTKASRYQTDPFKAFFANLNYSLTFVLYCAVNPAFRAALKQQFRRLLDKARGPSQSASTTSSSLNRQNVSEQSCSSLSHASYGSDSRLISGKTQATTSPAQQEEPAEESRL